MPGFPRRRGENLGGSRVAVVEGEKSAGVVGTRCLVFTAARCGVLRSVVRKMMWRVTSRDEIESVILWARCEVVMLSLRLCLLHDELGTSRIKSEGMKLAGLNEHCYALA